MRKAAKLLTLVMALSLLMAAPALVSAKEKPVLLKVPVTFSTELPGLGSTIKWVSERIGTLSGGAIKMKVYEPKKLVAPFEILESVSKGKVNAGYSMSAYWAGKINAAPIFSAIPFGPDASEYLAWMYYGNGLKFWQEMYDKNGYNVHVLLCGVIAPETSGWFNKEINTPEDLKGLRMRFFGFGGKVMQKMGVSTSLLPGGEIFPALEKKALDATEFSMPAIDKRLGFYKVVKYNYYPGWHQQASLFELLINKDTWNSLSKHQKMCLEIITRAATADSLAFVESLQAPVIKENVTKRGVINKYWSPEMLAAYKKAWLEVVEEEKKKDPFFAKVWDDLSKFREEYEYWSSVAFLPRPAPKLK
ncbi:MAG: TRAP transporter substrate-binding protein [Desulfarculaceae bacterium]|nr:TRAP transporter substrate-binding protein [Desulfarculaceae bacterium]